MKIYLAILSVFLLGNSKPESVHGEYYNHFGSKLKINPDSTFLYSWDFDLASSWSKGKWEVKNDTVYFSVIPVFDTLRIARKKDSLILSANQVAELITDTDSPVTALISSGGQNRHQMSPKLYYKGDRLYEIGKHGKPITGKHKAFWTDKKYGTWFVKK